MLKLTFSKSSVPETINIQVASFRCYKIRSNRSNGILVSMVTLVFNLYLFNENCVPYERKQTKLQSGIHNTSLTTYTNIFV